MRQYRIHTKTDDGWQLESVFTKVDPAMMHDFDVWAFNWLEIHRSEFLKVGETMYDIVHTQSQGVSNAQGI